MSTREARESARKPSCDPPGDADDLIGSVEASRIIGINPEAFHQRRKRGTLGISHVKRFGNALAWDRSEIERLAARERRA